MGIITSPNVIGCEERQAHEEPRALLLRLRNLFQKGVYSFHAFKSFWSLELFKNFINVRNQQMWTISVKNKRPCHTVFKCNFWTFPWYPNIDEEPSFVQVTSIRFPVSTSWNRTQAPSFDSKPLSASLTFFFEASHMPVASWYLTNPPGQSLKRLFSVFRLFLREFFWTDFLAMELFWW